MTDAAKASAPLVAIVTPVYNGEKFLAETMNSVQAQTHANVVHVILDNASTDRTPEIIARYATARVPIMVVRNEKTIPIIANWNAAVAMTPPGAKYFRVLCADDLIAPTFVERLVDLAERCPNVGVVGCGVSHRGASACQAGWSADQSVWSGREAAERFFRGESLIVAHQTLFRRSALDRRRPLFDERIVGAADTDACLSLLRGCDWGYVHDELAITRDHPDTVSRTQVGKWRLHASDYLKLLENHAEFAFGPEIGREWLRRYRRYYLRQMLRWWKEREVFDKHIGALNDDASGPVLWQFLDAIADWPLARLGLRQVWTGYPF